MENDREAVLERIKPNDKVLDIGGWVKVFPRANAVIDLNPYETRRRVYTDEEERFSEDTWIQGDIHSPAVWSRFKDKEFDFVICAGVLEDIRDPLYVCQQMNRVGKAGYIECPSRLRECAKKRAADPHAGFDHHRWIVDVLDDSLVFTPKLGWAHHLDYLGDHRREYLTWFDFHFVAIFWEGSFNYYERFHKGNLMESANLLNFYDTYKFGKTQIIFEVSDGLEKATYNPGSILSADKFLLPLEMAPDEIRQRYITLSRYMLNLHESYEGYVDAADCHTVSGWAWSEHRPHDSISVNIYLDELLIDTVQANLFRRDVANHTGTHGKHGYSYPMPRTAQDGRPHLVRVKFEGTDIELNNSPRAICC